MKTLNTCGFEQKPNRRGKASDIAAIAVLALAWSVPAAAQNVSPPAPAPSTPTAVTPSDDQKLTVASASCVQQLDDLITGLEIAGTVTEGIGLAAEVGAALDPTGISEAAAVATQVAGYALWTSVFGLEQSMQDQDYPECDTTFAGTVTVTQGGVNVTGNSIFNGNVGVNGDINTNGSVNANQVHTAQGISAHGGAIWLGNPDGVSYFDGITLGGGALSGAGNGGALAFTGDVTAIAIGNGSSATGVGGIAFGTGAATDIGVSIGYGAGEAGDAGVAVGVNSRAREATDTAVGNGATVNAANGAAYGANTYIGSLSDNGVAIGENTTIGAGDAVGSDNVTAVGRNIDIADGVDNAVALGTEADVSADGGVAIGVNSSASGINSMALGTGATATLDNQQVFGTANETYAMPGITSDLSKMRQTGLLELPTTDAFGNLASDGGAVFQALANIQAGLAVSVAMTPPSLTNSEEFGIHFGWGNYNGEANAMGFSAIGVVDRNLFFEGNRLAITAGAGVGFSDFFGYSGKGTAAGRAGLQLTW